MLVQQTARLLHAQKQPRILLKLDISKAFDSVSWSFLLEVLEKVGFGPIWRYVISGLLMTSSTQIMLNGVPGEYIQHKTGLRQGDSLSPLLFIIVMDVLNGLIVKSADEGMLQPLSTRSIQHRISLYADDVVIFLRPAASDLYLVTKILELFGDASGLKTNVQKSSMAPIHCSPVDMEMVTQIFPCKVETFPLKYLGLPLSLRKLSKEQLQPHINRLADLLPNWRVNLMTRVGRAIQVQHVLTATVIYHAMTLDLPKWDIKAIDKIRRGFIWKGRKDVLGGHCLVAWGKVTRPKELGGLGILDLQRLNWALRVRWLWLEKIDPSMSWADLPL
jgi:hypothetical protein